MFRIISGDFAKDTVIQNDKLVKWQGFTMISTKLHNAMSINPITR